MIVTGNVGVGGEQVFTDAPLELNITPPKIVLFASWTDWMVTPGYSPARSNQSRITFWLVAVVSVGAGQAQAAGSVSKRYSLFNRPAAGGPGSPPQ